MDTAKQLLTPEQFADHLQVSAAWVLEAARRGELPGIKVGRHWRFNPEAIELWERQRLNMDIETLRRQALEAERLAEADRPRLMQQSARSRAISQSRRLGRKLR